MYKVRPRGCLDNTVDIEKGHKIQVFLTTCEKRGKLMVVIFSYRGYNLMKIMPRCHFLQPNPESHPHFLLLLIQEKPIYIVRNLSTLKLAPSSINPIL